MKIKALCTVGLMVFALFSSGCASLASLRTDDAAPLKAEDIDAPARLNFELGVKYMSVGRLDVAVEKFEKAVEFYPEYGQAYNALGVLHEESRDAKRAEENFAKAVSVTPSLNVARMNYGRILCASDRFAAGEAQYLAATKRAESEDKEAAYIGAALCARSVPVLDRAESHFLAALNANSDSASALLGLADLSNSRGNATSARDYLQRFHDVAGYNPASLLLAVGVEEALNDPERREGFAQLLLSRFGNTPEAKKLREQL